jgi:hypothetical protein
MLDVERDAGHAPGVGAKVTISQLSTAQPETPSPNKKITLGR